MNVKEAIIAKLPDENKQDVLNFAAYCLNGQQEKKKDGTYKSPWFRNNTPEQFAEMFLKVKGEGLVFDGKHVTLQSTGITYDFVAYKNKMLQAYPETKIDLGVVVDGDEFSIGKEDGKVKYSHKIADAFNTPTAENITGAYCVIKNQRGEFETLLSKAELGKHKAKAKTKYIWNEWPKEMSLKTVIKKATKYHFEDVFETMNEEDNNSIDLDAPDESTEEQTKETIKQIKLFKDLKEMRAYFGKLDPKIKNDAEVLEAATKHADKLKKEKAEAVKKAAKEKALESKTYIFTKEVKRWGVEAGDIYNKEAHMAKGGIEKLLKDGVIKEEE